ncbi:hypothetical protein D3C75_967420 [compost metagenome]
MANAHNHQDGDNRLDSGKRNMPNSTETSRPVNVGGFIQRRIDHRNGSQINNGAPADLLPYIRRSDNPPEVMLFREPHNWFLDQMQAHQHLVHNPVQ